MYSTREDWLTAAVTELRPLFDLWAAPLPQKIRVACGFPSNARRSNDIGECWADTASADKTIEILISPVLDNPDRVFDVLVHELCHALPGAMNHGVTFQKYAAAMHLRPCGTGKQAWKATEQTADFLPAYGEIIGSLGAYPHAQLSLNTRKKQATRLLKAVCPSCQYTIRLTHKWAQQGLPTCVCGDTFNLDNSEV